MLDSVKTKIANLAARRYPRVAAFAVVALAIIATGPWWQNYFFLPPTTEPTPVTIATSSALHLPAALPVRLTIPHLKIDAPFEAPLGLKPNGEIAVPKAYDTVAYYQYGPTPGELGPAVVLGHVDSYQGPAVLYSLGQLDPGDEIVIDRADGTRATFAVERLERHQQSGFPTAEVYGDLNYAGLRLITCSGIYNRGTLRYSHNLIVFAKLVATSTSAVLD